MHSILTLLLMGCHIPLAANRHPHAFAFPRTAVRHPVTTFVPDNPYCLSPDEDHPYVLDRAAAETMVTSFTYRDPDGQPHAWPDCCTQLRAVPLSDTVSMSTPGRYVPICAYGFRPMTPLWWRVKVRVLRCENRATTVRGMERCERFIRPLESYPSFRDLPDPAPPPP